jgi:hypothetical protein
MLYRAQREGVPRPSATTPLEFQSVLATAWPAGGDDFAALTASYERRRYGGLTPSPLEVDDLRARWERLREVIRRREEAPARPEAEVSTAGESHSPRQSIMASFQLRTFAAETAGALAGVAFALLFVFLAVALAIFLTQH